MKLVSHARNPAKYAYAFCAHFVQNYDGIIGVLLRYTVATLYLYSTAPPCKPAAAVKEPINTQQQLHPLASHTKAV